MINEKSLQNLEKRKPLEPNTERTELIRAKGLETRRKNTSIKNLVCKLLKKKNQRFTDDFTKPMALESVSNCYEIAEALINKAKTGDLKAIDMILKMNREYIDMEIIESENIIESEKIENV